MECIYLLRPLVATTRTVGKGWFRKGTEKWVFRPEPDLWWETPVRLGADGTAEILAADWAGPAVEEDLFFAVRKVPFEAGLEVPLEKDANGHRWILSFRGRMEILDPVRFAFFFRDANWRLDVEGFQRALGTIPLTELSHQVAKYFGTMALDEASTDGAYADVTRLEQYRFMTEEAFSALFGKIFAKCFGTEGVVSWKVSAWKASSPDRDAAAAEEERLEGIRRNQALELAELQHRLEVAKLENDAAKLEAGTKIVQARAEAVFGGGANAGKALDALANVDLPAGARPDLAAALGLSGGEKPALRLLALAQDGDRFGAEPKNVFSVESTVRTRRVGPQRLKMQEGGTYGFRMTFPRDGYLTLLDVDERDLVAPMVPVAGTAGASVRVRAGETAWVGARESAWIPEPFEQVSKEGQDRFVAVVSDEPLLEAGETVEFGDELSGAVVSRLVERLAAWPAESWGAWVLQVAIVPR